MINVIWCIRDFLSPQKEGRKKNFFFLHNSSRLWIKGIRYPRDVLYIGRAPPASGRPSLGDDSNVFTLRLAPGSKKDPIRMCRGGERGVTPSPDKKKLSNVERGRGFRRCWKLEIHGGTEKTRRDDLIINFHIVASGPADTEKGISVFRETCGEDTYAREKA